MTIRFTRHLRILALSIAAVGLSGLNVVGRG